MRGRLVSAFSLVELLVVISLIMLLIAMLLPALGKMRGMARSSACKQKLYQIQTAHVVYVLNNDNKNFVYQNNAIYMTFLEEYHNYLDELRFCPEAPISKGGWGSAKHGWTYGTHNGPKQGSYGVNGFMYLPYNSVTGPGQGGNGYFSHGDYHANGHPNFWYETLEDGNPTKAPLYADCTWVDGWPMEWDAVPTNFLLGGSGADGKQMGRFAIDRHDMHVNVVFADGHAELHPLEELWTLEWHRQWRPPNPAVTIP